MSTFTEAAFLKKLRELNSSQQSIQTLSLWLIHHRRHHHQIVKIWINEFIGEKLSEKKKLTLVYLANDVIQNSKRKGPEYAQEFGKVLPKVFSNIGVYHQSLTRQLNRILGIWKERNVYKLDVIEDYRARLLNDDNSKIAAEIIDGVVNGEQQQKLQQQQQHQESEIKERRGHKRKSSKSRNRSSSLEDKKSAPTQSPLELTLGEPPEPEELIKALTGVEITASSDVDVREHIANLPPEISDLSCLNKIDNPIAAKSLSKQITEASDLIINYNARLSKEMEQRTRLAVMLRNYRAEQEALLKQAEERLGEYNKKHTQMLKLQKEVDEHSNNLPDLNLLNLPDVTTGGFVTPLPSAGDLFNLR